MTNFDGPECIAGIQHTALTTGCNRLLKWKSSFCHTQPCTHRYRYIHTQLMAEWNKTLALVGNSGRRSLSNWIKSSDNKPQVLHLLILIVSTRIPPKKKNYNIQILLLSMWCVSTQNEAVLLCILFSQSLQYNIILYNIQNGKTEKVKVEAKMLKYY